MHDSFKIALQEEFIVRCKSNPRYSLRAFALFLKTDPSTLSQFFRGKRKFSEKKIVELSARVGFLPEPVTTKDLTPDVFQMIADWYHHAIYELIKTRDFKQNFRWIGRKLGISIHEARDAVERLIRLELITVNKNGNWSQSESFLTNSKNEFTTAAFRKWQVQVLDLSKRALEEIPFEIRDHSALTVAMNSRRIPEVKRRIKDFRHQLNTFLQKDKVCDSVYQLGVAFFPLTITPGDSHEKN